VTGAARDPGLCKTCHGSGTILTVTDTLEFWPCPACGGAGARFMYGPAVFGPGARQRKRGRP
jgi:DnaJ-class molecular chaperone